MADKYITVQEAAQMLGVHETTVQRWAKSGHLVGRKIGPEKRSPWRILKSSVEEKLPDPNQQ